MRPVLLAMNFFPSFSLQACLSGSNSQRTWRSRAILVVALIGTAMAGGGCASGGYTYVARISTGERLEFPLEKGMPPLAKAGDIEVTGAAALPTKNADERTLSYAFGFKIGSGVAPKSVVIEDVTDAAPVLVVEDLSPQLEGTQWRHIKGPLDGNAPELAWLGHLGDTMRVYRFTITKADGKKVVLHQGWMVPGWMKAAMRAALGLPQL